MTTEKLARNSAHPSREGRCQVREREVPCLARPVVEVAMYAEAVDPELRVDFSQRTVRACEPHARVLRAKYGQQIVAVRPYQPEESQ